MYLLKDKPRSLLRVNLNDLKSSKMEIQVLNENDALAIAKISDNALFCTLWDDKVYHYSSYTSTSFLIYPDCRISYIPDRLFSCIRVCPIFCNDEVYVFGGQTSNGLLLTPEKYIISENKWKQIRKMSCGANYCNGFSYKNQIFFTGSEHKSIYIYNVLLDTYKEIHANLSGSGKILFLKNTVFYVIESSSNIFEISADDPNKFKFFGKISSFWGPISQIVQFKDSVYFISSYTSLYKFNLVQRSIEKLNLS
ncbi:unnamed protein product [Blepharisma stoltei]|uniref:Kelch motif family protein n=1 Tax=Blepharisma stoltei TaxID=1481888 RepID=A0AAU9J6P7_9CILI|nr:unnamed protein product [Blepharisma stoltei]